MKDNKHIKKIISLTGAVVMGCSAICAVPASAKVLPDTGIVSPQYVAVTSTDCSLSITGGVANCSGCTRVKSGYSAGTTVELQRYVNNDWGTIKTWNSKNSLVSTIDKSYSVPSGYQYRLRVTHSSYNSSDSLLEAFFSYSKVISC